MFSAETDIIIKPEEIWKYFIEHREELKSSMEPVAQNDDYDVIIYLTNEDDMPCLTIESSNVESEEYHVEGEDSCEDTVRLVYDLYLTDQIMSLVAGEEMAKIDREDMIADREYELDDAVMSFICTAAGDEYGYTDIEVPDDVIEDCKEHFLEYLYRKHGLEIRRPMELEDDEGEFFEEYPYDCMEFDPNPMYDDFKITDLAINGKDILALGVPQGKEVGHTLEMVRKFVVGGIFPNDHDILIERLKSIKKK